MTASEIRQTEDHQLQGGKWAWNKIQNGNVCTHHEWKGRIGSDGAHLLKHISEIEPLTRHKQGLARLGGQSKLSKNDPAHVSDEVSHSGVDTHVDSAVDTDFETDIDTEAGSASDFSGEMTGAETEDDDEESS